MVAKIILLQKVMLHYGKKNLFLSFVIFVCLSFTTVRGQKNRLQQLCMYEIFKHRKLPCVPCWGETHIKLQWYNIFPSLFFLFFITKLLSTPVTSSKLRYLQSSAFYRQPNVRSNVQYYKTMFVRTVQISSLATTCMGQPLLTFCSHPEQSWIFVLIVAALNITYIVLHLCCLS